MWAPLIFLILGQAYLLGADPVPKVEEPHNAVWWIKQEVIASDTSAELLWLRELSASNPEAATSWIRNTINFVWHVAALLDSWFGGSTYTNRELNLDLDAEIWEGIKAGRSDTGFSIGELRNIFSNDSLILPSAIKELESKGYEHSERLSKSLWLLAVTALYEENDSIVHNARWWVTQAILTDTSDNTQWLKYQLISDSEFGSTLVEEALRNTRDTVAAVTQAVERWPDLATKLAQNTENMLWYINQALEENQDADTWYLRRAKRDDTEEVFAWIRETVSASTQKDLTWFKGVAKRQPREAALYLRFILVGNSALYNFDPATEGPPFWLKLNAAKTLYAPLSSFPLTED